MGSAYLGAILITVLGAEFIETVLVNGAPSLSVKVFLKSLVIVTLVSKFVPYIVSVDTFIMGDSEIAEVMRSVMLAELRTILVTVLGAESLVVVEFIETVLANWAPSLSVKVFFKSLVVVALVSKSVPDIVSVDTFIMGDTELAEVRSVVLAV